MTHEHGTGMQIFPSRDAWVKLRDGEELRGEMVLLSSSNICRWQLIDMDGRKHTWMQGGYYTVNGGASKRDVVQFEG